MSVSDSDDLTMFVMWLSLLTYTLQFLTHTYCQTPLQVFPHGLLCRPALTPRANLQTNFRLSVDFRHKQGHTTTFQRLFPISSRCSWTFFLSRPWSSLTLSFPTSQHVPQQPNQIDCGVFLLYFAKLCLAHPAQFLSALEAVCWDPIKDPEFAASVEQLNELWSPDDLKSHRQDLLALLRRYVQMS